jgi:ATP-binding cassette subfamily B protein
MLRNPAILVLDEPTAALDVATEKRLVDGYESAMRGRTVIVITHRMDVARRADRVVVIGANGGDGGNGNQHRATAEQRRTFQVH